MSISSLLLSYPDFPFGHLISDLEKLPKGFIAVTNKRPDNTNAVGDVDVTNVTSSEHRVLDSRASYSVHHKGRAL